MRIALIAALAGGFAAGLPAAGARGRSNCRRDRRRAGADLATDVARRHARARLAARHRDEKRLRRPGQSGGGGGSETPFILDPLLQ